MILQRLLLFFARYGQALFLFGLSLWVTARDFRMRRKRAAEILDPSLTSDWSERRSSVLTVRTSGLLQGRRVTLQAAADSDDFSEAIAATLESGADGVLTDAIEATLESRTGGLLTLQRLSRKLLRRQIHLGVPPRVLPVYAEDQKQLMVRSVPRSLADRLLADSKARLAILACLQYPSDEITLQNKRFRIYRRLSRDVPAQPAIMQSLAALKDMARVLG